MPAHIVGTAIESRYDVPYELEQMRQIVSRLRGCAPLQAIFCDSKACASFEVTLRRTATPIEPTLRLVEQAVLDVVGGYNGLDVTTHDGTTHHVGSGNWQGGCTARETLIGVRDLIDDALRQMELWKVGHNASGDET